MSVAAVRRVVSRLGPDAPATDAELVAALAGAARERAFGELVSRHGPMVLGVCRGVLADGHAAEDAFQAVFLVLARKAATIRPPGAVGGWLYGVAVRTARKAKTAAARRQRREMAAIMSAPSEASRERPEAPLDRAELRAAIDAALAELPDTHRAAVVLCDLQGKTRAEAAAELNRAEGTVAAWLSRGRKALAARLARRGVALPAAGLGAVVTPAAVSAELRTAALGAFAGRGVPAAVLALAEEVMRGLASASTKLVAGVVAVGALLAAVATAPAWPAPDAPAAPPAVTLGPPTAPPKPEPTGFADHTGPAYAVQYAPDSKTLVAVGGGSAAVWDANARTKRFAADAEFAAFSGDGKHLFVLAKDEFRTLDAATGKTLATQKRNAPKSTSGGRTAAFAGGGVTRVEFDGERHHLRAEVTDDLYDLAAQRGRDPKRLPADGRGAAFSPDGKLFAGIHAATQDGETDCLTVWKTINGERVGTVHRGEKFFHPARALAWSPDGTEIAIGYIDGVRVHDAQTLKELRAFDKCGDTGAIAWSKDGKTLAVAVREGVSATVDLAGGDANTTSTETVATAFAVVLLDAQSGKQLRRFDGFAENLPLVSLAFSPDGTRLACAAGFLPGDGPPADRPKPAKDAKGLRVLNLDEPEKPKPMRWRETATIAVNDLVDSIAVDAAGKHIAVGTLGGEGQNTVTVFDAATRKKLWTGGPTPPGVTAVGFTPDGKTLAATRDEVTGFYVAATGESILLGKLCPGGHALCFAPDGERIAVSSGKKTVARGLDAKRGAVEMGGPPDAEKNPARLSAGVAWSPDGKRLALIRHEKWEGKWPVVVWGAGSGEPMALLAGHATTVTAVAWSKDGKLLASASADGEVVLWDGKTLKEVRRTALGTDKGKNEVHALAFSPDGKLLAAGLTLAEGKNVDRVVLLDTATGKQLQAIQPLTGAPVAVAFTPDGKTLIVGCGSRDPEKRKLDIDERKKFASLRLFSAEAEEPKPDPGEFADHAGFVYSVSYAPDGKTFVSVGNGSAVVWDADARTKRFAADAEFASFSRDGRSLFVLAKDEFRTLDAATGETRATAKRERPEVIDRQGTVAAFTPDGSARVEFDGQAHRLRGNFKGVPPALAGQKAGKYGDVNFVFGRGAAFSPDGKRFAGIHWKDEDDSPKRYGVLSVWDAATGARLGVIASNLPHPVNSFAWSPDGTEIAVGCGDVSVYDATTLKQVRKFDAGWVEVTGRFSAVAWSPDGKTLAVGRRVEREGRRTPTGGAAVVAVTVDVQLLDAQTGKALRHFGSFPDNLPVASLAFRPDGRQLACGAGFFPDYTEIPAPAKDAKGLRVLNLDEPKPEKLAAWRETKALDLTGWLGGSAAYSADGKVLYVGGSDGHVRAVDVATGKPLWEYKGAGHFAALALAPDGKQLVVTTKDGALFLDAATGKPGDVLEQKGSAPIAIAYMPLDRNAPAPGEPGNKVIFGSADGYYHKSWREKPKDAATFDPNTTRFGAKLADKYAVPLASDAASRWVVLADRIDRDTGKNKLGVSSAFDWTAKSSSGEYRAIDGHEASVVCAAWAKDNTVFVTGDADGVVITWDAKTFKEKSRVKLEQAVSFTPRGVQDGIAVTRVCPGRVAAVAVSADGAWTAAAAVRDVSAAKDPAYLEEVFVWRTGEKPEKLDPVAVHAAGAPFNGLASLAFTPDGQSLAACFCNFTHLARSGELVGKVRVFALPRAEPEDEAAGSIDGIRFSPDGARYLVQRGGRAEVFDAATRARLFAVPAEAAGFVAGGKLAAVGAKEITVYDAAGKPTATHPRPKTKDRWYHVAFSPDGNRFAAHFDQHVRVYETATGAEPFRLDGQTEAAGPVPVRAVAPWVEFSADGKQLRAARVKLAGSGAFGVVTWDAVTGERLSSYTPRADVNRLALAPDGTLAAIATMERVDVWAVGKAANENPVRALVIAWTVDAVAYSPDGKLVAVATRQERYDDVQGGNRDKCCVVSVFAAATGTEVKRLEGPAGTTGLGGVTEPFAFAPDGTKLLVVMNADRREGANEVKVIDLAAKPNEPKPAPNVTDVSYSPDGTKYLTLRGGVCEVFDATTGGRLHKGEAQAARFSADGKALFVLFGQKVLECDPHTGKARKETDLPKADAAWRDAVFSPDGKRLAVDAGTINVIDVATGKEVCKLAVRPDARVGEFAVTLGGFSPDGKLFAAFGVALDKDGQGGAAVWDATTGKRLHAFPDVPMDMVRAVGFAPSGDEIAVAYSNSVEVWVIRGEAKKNPVRKFGTAGTVTALAYSADGTRLAVGAGQPIHNGADKPPAVVGSKAVVQVFDATTAEEVKRLDGFEGVNHMAPTRWPVAALAFSPDGRRLVTGTGYRFAAPRGGEVKRFDLTAKPEAWKEDAVLKGVGGPLAALAVAPDGKSFAVAGEGGVRCFDAATRKPLWTFEPKDKVAFAVAFSPDGKSLYVGGKGSVARLDAATGKSVALFGNADGVGVGNFKARIERWSVRALAVSPDGKRLAGSDGSTAWTVDLEKPEDHGNQTYGDQDPAPQTAAVAWAPDGERFATITAKYTKRTVPSGARPDTHWPVHLWSAVGKAGRTLWHDHPVTCVAWSKDGKVIASGDSSGTVILWDAESGKELRRLKPEVKDATRFAFSVLSLAISADGAAVAAGVQWDVLERNEVLPPNQGVFVWAAATGAQPAALVYPEAGWSAGFVAICFAPDGRTLYGARGQFPPRAPKPGEPAEENGGVVVWGRKP